MTSTPVARQDGRTARFMDGVQAFGLTVLLFGLPFSEALKSTGLALAVAGFAGKLAVGTRPRLPSRGVLAALGAFLLATALAVVFARPEMRKPDELLTLGMTVVPFILVTDACGRASRRHFFVLVTVAGATLAALLGYADYMLGDTPRLGLGSIENAIPAAEYLGAVLAPAMALLVAEGTTTLAGPLLAFASGAMGIALMMTKSRGPMLGSAAGAAVAVTLALKKRQYAFFLVVVAALAGLWFVSANPESRLIEGRLAGTRGASFRVETWKAAVEHIAERPLLGNGPGSFPELEIRYSDDVWDIHAVNAHCAWLQLASDVGLVGAGAFILFLVLGVRSIVRSLRRLDGFERTVSIGCLGGVVVLLVAGMFSVTFDAEPGMLLFALLAMGTAGARGSPPSETELPT